MEDMNDILNPTDAAEGTDQVQDTAGVDEASTSPDADQGTGATTQVAAGNDVEATTAQVRAELAALARERERIRQKEVALDEERARYSGGTAAADVDAAKDKDVKDPQAELRELRKQHRILQADFNLDPTDEEAAQVLDDIEDKMEALRLSLVSQAQRTQTDQEKTAHDFKTEYTKIHEQFPFLDPTHEKANAELNDNINTYMNGRIAQGDSKAVAMRKAVTLFAPAYAERIGEPPTATAAELEQEAATTAKAERQAAADRLVKEKLGKGGFSEVRSVGKTQGTTFSGPTPMNAILGKANS